MGSQSLSRMPQVVAGDGLDVWRDLLGRRLLCRPVEQPSLALSPDGRVALSAGSNVSLVYCRSAVLAALSAPELGSISLQELFDETQREARGVRAPAVAHVPVDDQSASSLTWLQPPVLLAAPTQDGPLRCLTPIARSIDPVLPEGAWGLSGGLWTVCSPCDDNVSSTAPCNGGAAHQVPSLPLEHHLEAAAPTSTDLCGIGLNINNHGTGVCSREPRSITNTVSELSKPEALHSGKVVSSHCAASSSSIVCTASFCLNAQSEQGKAVLDSFSSVRRVWFTAFGKRDGTSLRRWNCIECGFGEEVLLWNEWTSCIAVTEGSDFLNSTGVKVALGSPTGEVRVFAVSWIPRPRAEFHLRVDPIWNGADNVLRGPISCIAFRPFPSNSSYTCFALAVGNSVAGVYIDENNAENQVCKARVSLAYDAHYESVTSLCFLPDGSVLSSSSDGSISRCMFNWEDGTEPCTFLEIVYGKSICSDSVVAMQPTPSAMLILHLITRPAVKGEIGEPAVMVKKKYHYLGRTSLLGVLAYPVQEGTQLRQALDNSLKRLIETGKHADIPLTLWDIELWFRANRHHRKQGEHILCHYLNQVRQIIGKESVPAVRNRFRKLALCIATALSRIVDNFDQVHPAVKDEQSKLRVSVLIAYHLATLQQFSRTLTASLAESVSSAQLQSLEAKLSFVLLRKDCCDLDHDVVNNSVREVSLKLMEHFHGKCECRALSMCVVCGDLPLIVDSNDPESFWCGNGDFSVRCVKSALPCTDPVPRACGGCGSLALCEINEDVQMPWEVDRDLCPLCNCELLAGRAENKQFS